MNRSVIGFVGRALGASIVVVAVGALIVGVLLMRASSPPTGAANVTAPPAPVELVNNTEAAAAARLSGLAGGKCTAWLSAGLLPITPTSGDLDTAVASAGGPGHWLRDGVWIGDANSAAQAFEAVWVAKSDKVPTEMWVETKVNGTIVEKQLIATTTPKGAQLWQVAGSGQVAPCSSNGE